MLDILAAISCLSAGMATETDQQVEKAARSLLDKGVDTVLVKLGSKGSLLVTSEQISTS